MIYLQPSGGLCNRLRAIASTYTLSNEYEDQMLAYWIVNKELKSKFSDLFHVSDKMNIVSVNVPIRPIISRLRVRSNYYNQDRRELFLEEYKADTKKKYYISTYSNYYNSSDYSWLTPIELIQERIDNVTNTFGGNCIGVHIRRTDNQDAIDHSPIELFVQAMDSEVSRDSHVRFYLATDDSDTKKMLIDRYGSRMIVNNDHIVSRETVDGMKDAVVDLFSLAGTNKIYGSHWSSFSKVASDIGQKQLTILKK